MKARYELTELLEAGELADRYLAQTDLGRPVVVKLFHRSTTDAAYAQALVRQWRAMEPIVAPRILPLVDLGIVDGQLAAVREHVPGITLAQLLKALRDKRVVMPPQVELQLTLQALELLQAAEGRALPHGSLTPANVLLSEAGEVALCDWGVLQALQASPELWKRFGSGKDGYRAPETLRDEPPTPAADVYAVGVMAYELLTLVEPFPGRGGVSTRRELPTPPSRIDRRIHAKLDGILLRALDPTPARRYRSATDFATAVRNHLVTVGGLPGPEDAARLVREARVVDYNPRTASKRILGTFELASVPGFQAPEPLVAASAAPAPRRDAPPLEVRARGAGAAMGEAPPTDEATHPGQAGPLEKGWEAPPAAVAPVRTSKELVPRSSGAHGPGLKSRIKVVEDFDYVPEAPRMDTALDHPVYAAPQGPDTKETPAASFTPVPAPARTGASQRGPSESSEYIARMSGGKPAQGARRQTTLFWAATGLLLLAAGAVGGLVWFDEHPPGGKVAASATRPAPAPPTVASTPPSPFPGVPAAAAPPVPAPVWDVPAPRRIAGFLTLVTTGPMAVFVDGAKVRIPAPLVKYPLRPGIRRIAVEDPETRRKRTIPVSIKKGKTILVDLTGPGAMP